MKRLIILLAILILPLSLSADMNTYIIGGVEAGGDASYTDTFTTDSNQQLVVYDSDWSVSDGTEECNVMAATDNVQIDSWLNVIAVHDGALAADQWCQCDVTIGGDNAAEKKGVGGRAITSGSYDGYFAYIRSGASAGVYLLRRKAGGVEELTSTSMTINDSTPYTLKIEISGVDATVNIVVDVDGTERINYDDEAANRIVTADDCGIIGYIGGGSGNAYYDNYSEGNL